MTRRFAIVLFGAIPATIVTLFAAPMGMLGGILVSMTGEPLGGLAFFVWGVAAVAGTCCLWLSAFRETSRLVFAGLVAGLIAIAPLTLGTVRNFPSDNTLLLAVSFIAPFLVALALLVESLVVRRRYNNGTDRTQSVLHETDHMTDDD